MKDTYKHNPEGVTTIVNSLKKYTSQYNDTIVELGNLIKSIEQSSAWIDLEIKADYINTCNSYVKIYNNLVSAMDIYINYLQKKSECASELEAAYARNTYE